MLLTCYYDLRYQPNTFDFVIFLAGANAYREQIKAAGLEIKIINLDCKERAIDGSYYQEEVDPWKFQNIISKLPYLLSKVVSVTLSKEIPEIVNLPCYPPPINEIRGNALTYFNYIEPLKDKYKFFHSLGFLKKKFFDYPEAFQCFSSPTDALKIIKEKYGENYITISLRNKLFQPLRNSNIESWIDICDYVSSKGFQPIILPDFEDYFNAQSFKKINYPVADEAVLDLGLRMAFYQNARHNLAINDDATSHLLLCSKAPYSIFKWVVPGISSCSAEYHRNINDLKFGEKIWFMQDTQFLLWVDDSKDFVIEHLKTLFMNYK